MEKEEKKELIFIYNAASGTMNAILDSMHKIFSPSTYPCELCALTFGAFSMKDEWEEFLEELPVKKTFLHKDEIPDKPLYKNLKLPVVLLKTGEKMEVIVS
ncbi:MAG: hypothetical protein H0X62_15285 [Bacteroidetes bacterium]|nr:hypothetical protein [Bacteroidota bacterium]